MVIKQMYGMIIGFQEGLGSDPFVERKLPQLPE
jgi:hypothetical protein